jgi:HTH-type transcriptional regulator, competence development regulator
MGPPLLKAPPRPLRRERGPGGEGLSAVLTCEVNASTVSLMTDAGFGQYLRDLRKRAGLSQRELAQQAGIDFTYLSKIENNRVDPPAEATIRALARAVGGDADDLLARARKMPPDLKRLVAGGSAEKTLLLRRIAQTPLSAERVQRMLRLLDEAEERGDPGPTGGAGTREGGHG